MKMRDLARPNVQRLHAYVPGEQPKSQGLIKLNTNENPFPPSPKVLAAVLSAADGRLRLYPNPTAQPLREALARLHHCTPDQIIVGNGSDELLAMAVRCFVEPTSSSSSSSFSPVRHSFSGGGSSSSKAATQSRTRTRTRTRRIPQALSRSLVQYFTPSYSLYPVLADIHGAIKNAVPLGLDFTLPPLPQLERSEAWDFHAALTFITTPNAPSGHGYGTKQLERLCRAQKGVVVLDEAYVDFANEDASALALKYPHVLVARTFSKAYSLCFQRVGYFIGHPNLISALDKIRDSYNVNGLGQVAALATLRDLPYYRSNFAKIIATRERLGRELAALGFHVFPSQTNFILVRPPAFAAQDWLTRLRARKILVRWFADPAVKDYLRITIGTGGQADALLSAAETILRE